MELEDIRKKLTADGLLQAVLRLYLFFLCAVFPLYTGSGRYDLMIYYKKDLFVRGSLIAGAAAVILLAVKLIMEKPELQPGKWFTRFDLLLGVFIVMCGISFAHAVEPYEGWNGAAGWFMGLKTILILAEIYVLYAKLMRWDRRDALLVFSGPFIVMAIAVLNRFGLAQIDASQHDPMYISTIGNVNWMSCFTAVVFSAGAGVYACGEWKGMRSGILWSVFLFIGFLSILTNGSDAVFLWLAVLIVILLCWGLSSDEAMIRVLHLLEVLILAFCFLAIVQKLRPDIRADYMFHSAPGIAASITRSFWWLPAAAVPAGIALYLKAHPFEPREAGQALRMLVIAGAVVTGCILLVQLTGIIRIPDEFGTGRGYLWRLTAGLFHDLPLDRKLIGVGPDCYGRYTLRDWDFMMALMEMFPGSSAANAHSEPLTMLMNLGILGTGAYFAAVIYGCLETAKLSSPYRLPVLAAVLVCTANQLVSFSVILSAPYLTLALALAGRLILSAQNVPEQVSEPEKKGPKKKKKKKKKRQK